MEKLIKLTRLCNHKMRWGLWVHFLNEKTRHKYKIIEAQLLSYLLYNDLLNINISNIFLKCYTLITTLKIFHPRES